MSRKAKYILAALFVALPFPFMLLFDNPKLGATALVMLAIPIAVYTVYRFSDADSGQNQSPPYENDQRD